MVIFDTNIVIDHLRQKDNQDSALMDFIKTHPDENLGLSLLSIQELYEGKSTRDPQKEQALLETCALFKILPYTYEIAQKAGEVARDEDQNIEFADAAIAATAIINDFELFTLNKKDFSQIKDLHLALN